MEVPSALRLALSLEVLGLHTCPYAYGPGTVWNPEITRSLVA